MVKMIPMTCPNCGASIDVKEGTTTCFCTYCGTKMAIGDDNTITVNINKTTTDQVKIEKLRLEHQRYEEAMQQMPQNVKMATILIVIMLLFLLASMAISKL